MYKERGTRGSKSEVVDRKRINEAHDNNRASYSMSHTVNGKGKAASNSVTIGKQLNHHDHHSNSRDPRSKATISDGNHSIFFFSSLYCSYCSISIVIADYSIRVRNLGFASGLLIWGMFILGIENLFGCGYY